MCDEQDYATITPFTVTYSPFGGAPRQEMLDYQGEHIAFLVPPSMTQFSDPVVMTKIVASIDRGYEFYAQVTGKTPNYWEPTTINGRDVVAVLPQTGGAGYGYVGSNGIEMLNVDAPNDYADKLYEYIQVGYSVNVPFYELGRNFWLYSDQLGALDTFIGGFAAANQWLSSDYAETPMLDTTGVRQREMVDLLDLYLADPNASWKECLSGGTYDPIHVAGQDFDTSKSSLAGSIYYRIYQDGGMSGYSAFWHAMAEQPKATTAEEVKANFLAAAEEATGEDYGWMFKELGTTAQPPGDEDMCGGWHGRAGRGDHGAGGRTVHGHGHEMSGSWHGHRGAQAWASSAWAGQAAWCDSRG